MGQRHGLPILRRHFAPDIVGSNEKYFQWAEVPVGRRGYARAGVGQERCQAPDREVSRSYPFGAALARNILSDRDRRLMGQPISPTGPLDHLALDSPALTKGSELVANG